MRVTHLIVLLWTCAPLARAEEPKNLLRNGDFEAGGKDAVADWLEIYPTQMAKPAPRYSVDATTAHGGKRAGSIAVTYKGGYTSLTQNVPPQDAKSVHFEAWARIDGDADGGAASIMIWFTVPEHAEGGVSTQSRRLTNEREWTLLTIDAPVPAGTTEMAVRCGVFGPCAASFDDALLTTSTKASTACKLAVAHGDYTATATGSDAAPWISVSVPFPLGGQTPLALRATSEPPGKVVGLALTADRENRPLRVLLAPLQPGEAVAIKVETLALLRDRPLVDGKGVAVPNSTKAPKDVQVHLKSAPGVDVGDSEVKKLAAALARKDFQSLMSSVSKALDEGLEYAGGESQGAQECLKSGKAVCTGYANTAASILIAAKVPARILACTTLGSRLQEHYIVEAWGGGASGWCRMESTAARYPWPDSENLVLRIVYPDAKRSPIDVPLYSDASANATCGFRMGDDQCWQGGELLATSAVEDADVAAIETSARARFELLLKQPADGPTLLLVDAQKIKGLRDGGRALCARAQEWLEAR